MFLVEQSFLKKADSAFFQSATSPDDRLFLLFLDRSWCYCFVFCHCPFILLLRFAIARYALTLHLLFFLSVFWILSLQFVFCRCALLFVVVLCNLQLLVIFALALCVLTLPAGSCQWPLCFAVALCVLMFPFAKSKILLCNLLLHFVFWFCTW